MKIRARPIIAILFLAVSQLQADWKEEIGFTRLQLLAGGSLPTAPSAGLTQVEANEGLNYAPNTASPLFAGKRFFVKSGNSATSNHAQRVATNFFANTSQLPGVCDVDLYSAGDWLTNFIDRVDDFPPVTESRAVQNHSWIFTPDPDANPPILPLSEATVADVNKRLDFAINRDGFVCVVGENNGSTNPLPQLLGQGYHTISVGRDDGDHSAGVTTHEVTGRMKPDIVAPSASPEFATSWTTPMVAGAAGLLHAKLTAAYSLSSPADRPRVIKALLLASATKNTVPNWENTPTLPLDDIYGAGELNVHHAYQTLIGGRAAANNARYGISGWAAESMNRNSSQDYFFTIPAGAPSTPFCAALTWHRTISGTTWSSSLPDFRLHLHAANGTTRGSVIASSNSAVDNVELIYQSALLPGDYSIVVTKVAGSSTPYALAWHSLPACTITTTTSTAREIDGQPGIVTFSRNGGLTLPLLVPLTIGGSASPGTHYQALPTSVTIPAGQSSTTLQIIPVADSIAQGTRTVTVAVAPDFALASNPNQIATVSITDKPFDVWRLTHFSVPQAANPAVGGENGDPDGDQLVNLIEYALGLTPTMPDPSPVAMIDSSGYLALTAPRNPAITDITWGAVVSGNLETWTPAEILAAPPGTFQARDTVLRSAAERRFIRLKITRP